MKKNESAIVLFSGGQDSTTCLFWSLTKFINVKALCINYGQKHSLEIETARKIANKACVSFQVLDAPIIGQLVKNSLTSHHLKIKNNHTSSRPPNTFVPGRNLFFFVFAAVLAYSYKIHNLVTGVSESDYSGYPDCRKAFINSANTTLNLAMDIKLSIHTPLMNLNKEDTWELAYKLGIFELVKNETLTCYNGILAEGCGQCNACILRNKGLKNFLNKKKHKLFSSSRFENLTLD